MRGAVALVLALGACTGVEVPVTPPPAGTDPGTSTTTPTPSTTTTDPSGTSTSTTTSTGTATGGTATGGSTTTTGPWVLDLDLGDQGATEAAVTALGGTIQGGAFGPDGWTTVSRDDRITVPLPAGLDASVGSLEVTVAGFEWELTPDYWESWILVSLDAQGAPYAPTPTGDAGVQLLYQGFNPDDPGKGYRPVAYFNLDDPSCTDWHDCTGEDRTPSFWLTDDGTPFTLSQSWDGPVSEARFEGNGTVVKAIDLTATSPAGLVDAPQFTLMINACGDSDANPCGPWGGPADLKGGPIGVTYGNLRLELDIP